MKRSFLNFKSHSPLMHLGVLCGLLVGTQLLAQQDQGATEPFYEPENSAFLDASPFCDDLAMQSNNWLSGEDRGWLSVGGNDTRNDWSFFAGLDGSKQPQDLGVNANLGSRVAFDWGGALVENWGLGLHLGTALVASANAVQVFEALGASSDRVQSFSSAGLFQRLSGGWYWAGGYDFLYQNSYDSSFLGQWRVDVGRDIGTNNQVGIRAAISDRGDTTDFIGTEIPIRSINQGHLYWRHRWPSMGQTTVWAGIADQHAQSNAALGPLPRRRNDFLMGADILLPLSDRLAIYGETNLIMPPDSGTVDAFLGIAYYPRGARSARSRAFSPILPLASSTNFSVDARW